MFIHSFKNIYWAAASARYLNKDCGYNGEQQTQISALMEIIFQ